MNKNLLIRALKNEITDRTPWVPFVGCHAAKLIGVGAKEYFNSEELIYRGLKSAIEEYNPDGIPIIFDLQAEAEVLGCKLKWANDNPPSVITHPLEDGKKIADLKIPTKNDGRFPIILNVAKRISNEFGKNLALYGLITGPFTLALHLFGTDIFYEMLDNPDGMKELMIFCKNVNISVAKMYIEAGIDVVAVVDPMTSQISPENFNEFVTPYCKEIFEFIRSKNVLSSFFVCGNAKRNIEEMCKTNPDNISIDENIPLEYVREICEKYDISFGGNIKLTITMLFGDPTDNIKDAQNCITLGGNKGFILSPGCDMPFDTPIQNVKAITALISGDISKVLINSNINEQIKFELPDYKNEKNVIIDVITLDSESCAPCQYMMNAVKEAVKDFKNVEVFEHKIKEKKSIKCMQLLHVLNIPTICIDGEIKFVSIIPDKKTLQAEIKKSIVRK